MELKLSDQSVEVLAVDFVQGKVDWRRVDNENAGTCVSDIGETDFAEMEQRVKEAIEAEVHGLENPHSLKK